MASEKALPEAYNLGVAARQGNEGKAPPKGLSREMTSWWLAGWNDEDIVCSASCELRRKWREKIQVE